MAGFPPKLVRSREILKGLRSSIPAADKGSKAAPEMQREEEVLQIGLCISLSQCQSATTTTTDIAPSSPQGTPADKVERTAEDMKGATDKSLKILQNK